MREGISPLTARAFWVGLEKRTYFIHCSYHVSYHRNVTGMYNGKIQAVCIDCFGALLSDKSLHTSCSRGHTIAAPSYPCPLQFFATNGQVWSASRIAVTTTAPVVRPKRTNPRNSSCMLQVSSTNRIDMPSCSLFQVSVVSSVMREGACSERCMLLDFTNNFVPQILHCYLYYVILNSARRVSSISCALELA